jgi:hypothetical protein
MKKTFHQCKAFLSPGLRCPNECIYNKDKKEYSNWCVVHAERCNLLNNDYKKSCQGNEKWNCKSNIELTKNTVEEYINFLINCVQDRKIFENTCIFTDLQDKGHEQFIENLNEKKRTCEEYLQEIIEQIKIQDEQKRIRKQEAKSRRKELKNQKREAQKKEEKEIEEEEEKEIEKEKEDDIIILEKLSSLQLDQQNVGEEIKKIKIKSRKNTKSQLPIKSEQQILDEAIEENKKRIQEEEQKLLEILEKIKKIDEYVYKIFIDEKLPKIKKINDENINLKLDNFIEINFNALKTYELLIDKKLILEKLSKSVGVNSQKELMHMVNTYFPEDYKYSIQTLIFSIFKDFQNENEKNPKIRGLDYYRMRFENLNPSIPVYAVLKNLENKIKLVLELKKRPDVKDNQIKDFIDTLMSPKNTQSKKSKR